MFRRFTAPLAGAWAAACVHAALAHEAGAPFSRAIVDPLILHHAHIENEQRVNLFHRRGVAGFGEPKRNAFEGELELAWRNESYTFGVELFVPFARHPSPDGAGSTTGIGDVELRPLKWAFVNRADLVLSTATGVVLPTGSRRRGLGSGDTVLAQHLFADKAFGDWFVGANLGAGFNAGGDSGRGVEYGLVLSYTFPERAGFVVSPSLEWVKEKRLAGPEAGEKSTTLVPGVAFWWPRTGWQLRFGLGVPRSGIREADRTFMLQVGNHLTWDRVLSAGRR